MITLKLLIRFYDFPSVLLYCFFQRQPLEIRKKSIVKIIKNSVFCGISQPYSTLLIKFVRGENVGNIEFKGLACGQIQFVEIYFFFNKNQKKARTQRLFLGVLMFFIAFWI